MNGCPAGVGTTRRVPGGRTASRARPHGSGFITMPGPPPYGASSTVRWTSSVHCRRSWIADRHQAALDGLAQQRLVQRRQVLGEDRDDVDTEARHQSSSRPSGGSTTTNPPATSTVGTIAATNGTSASPRRRAGGRRAGPGPRAGRRSPRPGTCRRRGARSGRPAGGRRRSPGPRSRAGRRRRPGARCCAAPRPPRGSSTPSIRSSRVPLCQCTPAIVSGPRAAGSVANTAPGTKRRSGSSVRTSTVTSPRTPWGRPMRPTTTVSVEVSCGALKGSVLSARRCRRRRPAGRGRRRRSSPGAAPWRCGRRGR